MLVKIDKNEIEPLKKICAILLVSVRVFTMETNSNMVQVEITESDGSEPTPKDAWYICSSFRMEVQLQNI